MNTELTLVRPSDEPSDKDFKNHEEEKDTNKGESYYDVPLDQEPSRKHAVSAPPFPSQEFSLAYKQSISSPGSPFPQSPRIPGSPFPQSPRIPGSPFPQSPRINKHTSSPALLYKRDRPHLSKEHSSKKKYGTLQRRHELHSLLQHRGFSDEELDSIVSQFKDIQVKLEGGEWVTREVFKKFFGVREQSFCDQLFDVFKQKHKMHNFQDLTMCPSPQSDRHVPTDNGIEMDVLNLRDFLCGLLLLQSNDIDKKLRMVFDLYNSGGLGMTKEILREMLTMSAKENKIILSEGQIDKLVQRVFVAMDLDGTGKITFESFKEAFHFTPQSPVKQSPFLLSPQSQKFEIELEERPKNTSGLNEFLAVNTTSPALHGPKFGGRTPTSPAASWSISMEGTRGDSSDIGTENPDFVDRVYEDVDPRRTRRKMSQFENFQKTNYVPQHESIPKPKTSSKDKIKNKIHSSGTKYLFLGAFLAINIALFLSDFFAYSSKQEIMGTVGWGVPIARGFATVLKFDTVLILVPVSRSLLTYLRASPVHRIVPLDKNIAFHKFMACVIVVASVGHWFAHIVNFYRISSASLEDLQAINPTYFTHVPSFVQLNFLTIPGITGYIMLLVLLVIVVFSLKRFRKQCFEKFYSIHHVFMIFYAALLIHGLSHILGPNSYWKWIVGPGVIYALERCVRVYKQRRGLKVLEAKILPDRALMLKMENPPRHFAYKAGQYIFVNFPVISKFEWHPFTVTSAPHEEFVSVHIRAAGNWTNKVYNLCKEISTSPQFEVNIEGPYGSASEHVFSYKYVIMIGAGIGVTPFASVLKSLQHKIESGKATKLEKVHFFWTCREQGAFQWFADILSQLEANQSTKGVLEINTFLTGALAQHDIRSILLWYGLQQEYEMSNVDLVTGLSSRTYWGRPNFERIIAHLFMRYAKERVGVFFCGPREMAHSLNASCRKHATLNASTVYFHKENF